ncbi:conserved Plasmodium protein, unknown function [Plasmodium gallinaceum]|uniref:Uncharacterized protein n=1 Tax=Plasmodium gallinaceum TaxID=5849 RepID=A0A1J1GKX4_PLAGA|nr:conserved Plasmodium protein, unknown function [Plasmodium gallinaceum]CRG93064.1 conserved Plasmodium protein, unknown function [Plasmodium gallinaceum]
MEVKNDNLCNDIKKEDKKNEIKITKKIVENIPPNRTNEKNNDNKENLNDINSNKDKNNENTIKENKNEEGKNGDIVKNAFNEKVLRNEVINNVDNMNFKKLRKKLNNLNYKEHLCLLCTPLVQIIFNDLIQAIQNFQKLSNKYEECQKKYKELKNEKKTQNTEIEQNTRKNKIENDLSLIEEKNNTNSMIKEQEQKIKDLNKKLKEETSLKESYILENKKLKFTIDIIQSDKKEKLEESIDELSNDNFSCLNSRMKSFDDLEIEKKKKNERTKYNKETSIINDYTLSLGKELTYYKKLCKDFKIEIEKLKKNAYDNNTKEKTNDNEKKDNEINKDKVINENTIEEKNFEINYLKKRLNEYEIEIRKLNELRMMNGIKEELKNSMDSYICESTLNENYNEQKSNNFDIADNMSVDVLTKNEDSVNDINNLNKILKVRNNEIYHLKNRVLLLETELQNKNDEEKKLKEKLNLIDDNDNNKKKNNLYKSENSENDEESLELNYLKKEIKIKKDEINELNNLLEKLKIELKEEKSRSEKYEKQYNEEKSEIAILKDELKNLEKEIHAKESEFNLNRDTINSLKLESAEFNNIISCSNETKKHLTDYIHNLLNKLSESNDKIDELKDSNILQKQKIEAYKKEIKKLKNDLIDSNNQMDEFASVLDKKDETIENFKCKLENLNKECGDLTIKYNELLKENKNLQITNSSYNANTTLIIQQLQQEIEILNITNSHLKKIEEDYKIVLQEKTIIEEAAIKIQTELKKSVDKIKNLETYIQTLSVEISNLKSQRDDSLDALTKVAIDKTQYENELIQSKNIIYDLKKQLNEYENNVKFVQNNISEINMMHLKKEEEQIILKNEIKTLRENLNEKTITLELLQEKEKKLEQNAIAYDEFHLNAQKKYNSYEKMIENLKKEIDELTINNNDNIIIIEKLKNELKELNDQEKNNANKFTKNILKNQNDIVNDNNIGIIYPKNINDNNINEVEKENVQNKEEGINYKTDNKELYKSNSCNNTTKEEENIYDYNDDFTIFINTKKKNYKNKLNNNVNQEEKIKKMKEKNNEIDNLFDLKSDANNKIEETYVNETLHVNKREINVKSEEKIKSKSIKSDKKEENNKNSKLRKNNMPKNDLYSAEKISEELNETDVSSNSKSINIDFLSFNKKSKNCLLNQNDADNDHSITLLKELSLSSLNNIEKKKNDKLNINNYSSENSSYLDNNDISLFSSLKIKKMFNLSSTNNKDIEKKNLMKYTKLKSYNNNKNNTYDINISKSNVYDNKANDSYDDIIFNLKNSWKHREEKDIINEKIKKNQRDNNLGLNFEDSNITLDKSYFKKEKNNNMKNNYNNNDYEDNFQLSNVQNKKKYIEEEKKKKKLLASSHDIKHSVNNTDYNKKKISKISDDFENSNEYNKLKEIKNKKNINTSNFNSELNLSKNNKKNVLNVNDIKQYNKYNNDTYNNEKNKKSYNFISQTSYEANSNTSSILLDSLSSDLGHNVSVDHYNNNNRKNFNNQLNNLNFKSKIDYNSILYSSNDSHTLNKEKKLLENKNYNRNNHKNIFIKENNNNYENSLYHKKVNGIIQVENYKKEEIGNSNDIKSETFINKSKIKKDLYNKYMNVLKSLKSDEIDASINTTNNKTIDLTNDLTKVQENSTSMLSSSKTLQKDSLLSNLSKFKFNEEIDQYKCDPLNIIKPIEESNREDF